MKKISVIGILFLFFIGMFISTALADSGRKETGVKRVVVLNSNALEAMYILGAEKKVVGVFSDVERDKTLAAAVKKVPRIGRWNAPNMEAICKVDPDIIITYRKTPSTALEKQAALFHIKIIRLDLHNTKTFDSEFRALAQLIGKKKEAETFLTWKNEVLKKGDNFLARVTQEPSVYVENFAAYKSLGKGSAGNELLQQVGAKSITANLNTAYPLIGNEWLIAQDPDVIVKVPGGKTTKKALMAIRQEMGKRPLWSNLSAIQKGRIGVLHTMLFSGARAPIGRLYLIQWLHPKEGKELNPLFLHQEYYRLFLRQPYQGTYVLSPKESV